MSDPIPMRSEVARKALHLVALVVPAAMLALGRPAALAAGLPLALLAAGADVLRARSEPFAAFINRWFGWMMRAEERPPVPAPVVFNGATWVLVTAVLLALLVPLAVGMPAFIAFMLGDAAAALVGRRFGRHRWPGTSRTVEGSLAFLATAALVLLVLPLVAGATVVAPSAGAALGVAAAMAAAEGAPLPVNDNVAVPLVGALLLLLFVT